jgi:hypothetical protein
LNIPQFITETTSPGTGNNCTPKNSLHNSVLTSVKNFITGIKSTGNIDFNQEQIKSPKIEQEGFTPKDDRSTNCDQEEENGIFNSNKDKINNKKLIFEVNYKPIASTFRVIKFIKCQFDNRLAAFCNRKEKQRDPFYIKIFEPIIDDKNGKVLGYKTDDQKDCFYKQLKSEFSDFTGFCDYTFYSKNNNNFPKKENEWKFLCFGNQLLKVTCEEGKKLQIETKLKFKDVNFRKFSHFIVVPFEQDKDSSKHFPSLLSSNSNTLYLIVENAEIYLNAKNLHPHSIIHSLILTNQEKVTFKKLFESKSPQIQSICHLYENIIAIGGINNHIEIFSFEKEDEDNVKFGKIIEVLKTQHNNGIYCITVFEKWFISGGGNGSFIIWSLHNLRMLNVIFDEEATPYPLISIIKYNSPFGENTLCCSYKSRGIGFWLSETDLQNKERIGE